MNNQKYCSYECLKQDWRKVASKHILAGVVEEGESIPFGVKVPPVSLDWEVIFNDKTFLPSQKDVGHILKVECAAVAPDGRISVVAESSETSAVIGVSKFNSRLMTRKTILAPAVMKKQSIPQYIASEGGGAVIRVMSYNLLAEVYATRQLYPYCPIWAISWGYRRQIILRELDHHSADVLCLQEMQQDHYDDYMAPQLKARGYEGLFKAKTRESMGRKGKIDGCAIFYKTSKFRLLESNGIELNALAYNAAEAGNFQSSEFSPRENQIHTEKVLKRLSRDNVAQVAIFETIPTANEEPQRICVVCTHIFWDPEYSDVKFWQTQALLHELNPIIGGGDIPLVLCGDFNSTPESTVVHYLARDAVDVNHDDFNVDPLNILSSCSMVNHGFGLASGYSLVTGSEPKYTNYTAHYSGVLDYIWVTQNNINAISVLDIPEEKTLRGEDDTFMPNSCFPSDHVSLCLDLHILRKQNIRSRPATPNPPMSPPMSPSAYPMNGRNYGDHMYHGGRTSYSSPNPGMVNQYHMQQHMEDYANSPSMSPSAPSSHHHQQYGQEQQNPPYYYYQ